MYRAHLIDLDYKALLFFAYFFSPNRLSSKRNILAKLFPV